MTWLKLSLKEWQRRPLRTSVTAAGVAIATAALFSLLAVQRGYHQGLRQELDRLGAHLLLAPKGCPYDAASIALHGASWPCYLKENYLEEVRSVPGIFAAAPAFMAALDDESTKQAVYIGIETNMLALKPGWHITGKFPRAHAVAPRAIAGGVGPAKRADPGLGLGAASRLEVGIGAEPVGATAIDTCELLVGSEVAREHHWEIGQNVRLPGVPGWTGMVAGLLAPTQGADDSFIYLPLKDAQQMFHHPGELTHVLVRLSDPNELDHAVAQLRGCDAGLSMNVVPLAHLFHTIQSLVNSTGVVLGCLMVLALAVAGAGVANTVLMAVSERSRDLGVMRAVGASRGDVFRLVCLETVQVCVSGGLVGLAAAFLGARLVEVWVRSNLPFAPSDPLVRWEWGLAGACLAGNAVLGTLAGFLPAWRAAAIMPTVAIRAGKI
jgi:putative ABC transport system permease protein